MTNIDFFAREVLNMRTLQMEYEKMSNAKRIGKKVDGEEMTKTYSEMREAERLVQQICMDILGIEEK